MIKEDEDGKFFKKTAKERKEQKQLQGGKRHSAQVQLQR